MLKHSVHLTTQSKIPVKLNIQLNNSVGFLRKSPIQVAQRNNLPVNRWNEEKLVVCAITEAITTGYIDLDVIRQNPAPSRTIITSNKWPLIAVLNVAKCSDCCVRKLWFGFKGELNVLLKSKMAVKCLIIILCECSGFDSAWL